MFTVIVVCTLAAFTGWAYLRMGRIFFERKYGKDPE